MNQGSAEEEGALCVRFISRYIEFLNEIPVVVPISKAGKSCKCFPLENRFCLFGRSKDCDIIVSRNDVDGVHCQLEVCMGEVFLTYASEAGERQLQSGDTFKVGARCFRIEKQETNGAATHQEGFFNDADQVNHEGNKDIANEDDSKKTQHFEETDRASIHPETLSYASDPVNHEWRQNSANNDGKITSFRACGSDTNLNDEDCVHTTKKQASGVLDCLSEDACQTSGKHKSSRKSQKLDGSDDSNDDDLIFAPRRNRSRVLDSSDEEEGWVKLKKHKADRNSQKLDGRSKWTTEEISVLQKNYSDFIKKGLYPTSSSIKALIDRGMLSKGRTVLTVKAKLQNLMKKGK